MNGLRIKRQIIRQVDVVIMLVVFICVAAHIWTFFAFKGTNIIVKNQESAELLRFVFINHDLFSLVLSGLLIWKAYRLKACLFGRTATWMFTALSVNITIWDVFSISTIIKDYVSWGIIIAGLLSMIILYLLTKFSRYVY